MTRKVPLGLPGYAASVAVLLLIGVAALWLTGSYPASGRILLVAVGVALAGLWHRWRRHTLRQRRRAASEVQIRI
jgi:membrane protein implicated in regulation of membrane protease activity